MSQPHHHPAFQFVREELVDSLNIMVQEYNHSETGAVHYHLKADNPENVFLVALRTVPKNSTGVAHILEHTALCGSKTYPVRDPFFMMTRRSLNTFMNAFTSSDWTAYPFASLNRKDFNNLLDVYLDAVFFSRLDQLDFAQEGHRLDFAEENNPESPLVYKGVVYNEMKGAMSSVPSQLWQTLTKHLFPTTTYHYNSGGDPETIPDLTYEQLLQFYRTHYHPSNAIFMTYGDIPVFELQEKFETHALKHFERLDYRVEVEDEKRYYSPIRVQESYPCNEEVLAKKTHHVIAWLLGKSTNLEETLKAQLLSSVLLDNSACPLMYKLETSRLGTSPSPLCGLDDSQRELTFICGLQGSEVENCDDVEAEILGVLNTIAKDGIPQEDIESALHQLELHQREIGGDSYPYGLQLILTGLTAATHRGDPVKLINLDPALDKLREEIKHPDFIKNLCSELLINNQHRVRLTLSPDANIASLKEAAEIEKLARIKASMSADEKQVILQQAQALKERQNAVDDESVLPKVTLEDVPQKEPYITPDIRNANNYKLSVYPTGTNGLVYQQVIYNFPQTDSSLLSVLPMYSNCLTELGVGSKSYLDVQRWQAKVSGGFSVFSSLRGAVDTPHNTSAYLVFSGKALNRNQGSLTELMEQTISSVRFDETDRLRELVAQICSQREQSVTGNGHALAMAAAVSGICANANLTHQLTGLAGIKSTKALNEKIESDEGINSFASQLKALHEHFTGEKQQYLLIAEENHLDDFSNVIAQNAPSPSDSSLPKLDLTFTPKTIVDAWLTNAQVNFCAKAYPTVSMGHPDAAPLVVLGNFLRNGFLHKAIREQGGAYGGGATQDSNIGAFKFYSYRDPRLEDTLTDFDKSVEWLLNESHSWNKVEEAILGTISSIDRSESPAGRAKRMFHSELHGRTLPYRQAFRERVLATTVEDLKRVAETYLIPGKASTAVVTSYSNKNKMTDLGFLINEL